MSAATSNAHCLTPSCSTAVSARTTTPDLLKEMLIDSHIHLYPASEQDQLAWLTQNHPLHGQHSVNDYLAATSGLNEHGPANVRGFVFIETDRKHDLATEDFECPLKEVSFVARIQQALPREGEGHTTEHADLVLGIVPWAPLPLGADKLSAFVDEAKGAAGATASKIVGFRYIIQDKPLGTCLGPEFIESLKWMGRNGYTFDVGIDMATEPKQGRECIAMMKAAHQGVTTEEKVGFIINHIIKPDISHSYLFRNDLIVTENFRVWQETILELSKFEKTYMKLSGSLSQMVSEAAIEGRDRTPEQLYEVVEPWLSLVLEAFGPRRIMWGSDWPVCEATLCGKRAWGVWRGICEKFVKRNGLGEEDRSRIWYGTAVEAYGLKVEDRG